MDVLFYFYWGWMDLFYSQVNKIVFCFDGKKFMVDGISFWYHEYFPFKISSYRGQILLPNPTNVFEIGELVDFWGVEFARCFSCGFCSGDAREGLIFYSLDVDLRRDRGWIYLFNMIILRFIRKFLDRLGGSHYFSVKYEPQCFSRYVVERLETSVVDMGLDELRETSVMADGIVEGLLLANPEVVECETFRELKGLVEEFGKFVNE